MWSVGYIRLLCLLNYAWTGSVHLDENLFLKWRADNIAKILTLSVEVRAKGWFGIGFSRNGRMDNSDLVVGWITSTGQIYLQVLYINIIYIIKYSCNMYKS